MWGRKRMLQIARRLKIPVPDSMSDLTLYNKIMAAPPTDEQLLELLEILLPLDRYLPDGLTFGKALRIINTIRKVENEKAARAMRLEGGQVRHWPTDTHPHRYIMVAIIPDEDEAGRVWAFWVRLSRSAGFDGAVVTQDGERFRVHPKSMQFVSLRIDLETWHPPDTDEVDGDPSF